jgi:Spy/CpxP family protein refolding chaperone
MKQLIIILLCLSILSVTASHGQTVQPDRISLATHLAKADHETSYMRDSLNLSAAQVTQVDSVNKQYLKNISLLESQAISVIERKQKMAEYKAKRDNDLADILTTQQFQKYRDLLKSQEDRMNARQQTH